MAIYDLYGFLSIDIDEAKNLLEAAINIKFEARESSYQGGNYFRSGKTSHEHFVLKRNIDPYDDEPAEMSFPEYPTLFYVNDTLRSDDLQEKMARRAESFVLLRHEDI
jgi:hypothetical protein